MAAPPPYGALPGVGPAVPPPPPPGPPPAYPGVGPVLPPTLIQRIGTGLQGAANTVRQFAPITVLGTVPMALVGYSMGADVPNSVAFGLATMSAATASLIAIDHALNPNVSAGRTGLLGIGTGAAFVLSMSLANETFLNPGVEQYQQERRAREINLERRAQEIADVSLMPRGEYFSLPELPPSWAHSPGMQYSQRINPDNTVSLCNRLSGEDAWVCIPR